ncbi:ATP phosphoribosyltransferase regulatory subunit [Halioxenophilus sp. WMMB6]|uniref:ATP phosphoribosyltransferase regulatory subunit n=1 Tax=Halioxenophilus sp. WMMB6 TaxID=3073815 RepID=UPI00295EEF9A|nr:ATP phosphoribosyltransferase regulatory subunit [Halioxenophilus sp. WMMB6]
MSYADRWLLPDGVEEILPEAALQIESQRRQLLDLYQRWGYDLVIPPMIEYTDSLLIGLGQDIDLLTFRVTDQLSGRMMGIRADITPQIARMDAHSFKRPGVSRLCYAGHVLHAKPKLPLATRSPIQAGVELFGAASLSADVEVISLLLESLDTIGMPQLHIDLGHVAIYRSLAAAAGFSESQEQAFFDLLQKKSAADINSWVGANLSHPDHVAWFKVLPELAGDASVLEFAKTALKGAPAPVFAAIEEMARVAQIVQSRWPQVQLHYDMSEVRGYHYHTGIVFAAFAPGYGGTIARGGRYDSIGEVFGRARPAIGFTVDISTVTRLLAATEVADSAVIFAPGSEDPQQWRAVQSLRRSGHRVICGMTPNDQPPAECQLILVMAGEDYQLQPIAALTE